MSSSARHRIGEEQAQLLAAVLGRSCAPAGLESARVEVLGASLSRKRDAVLKRLMPATMRFLDTGDGEKLRRLFHATRNFNPYECAGALAQLAGKWRVPQDVARELIKRRKPAWIFVDWQQCEGGLVIGLWFGSALRFIAFCHE